MKAINTALAILILMLTGCASQGTPASEVQAATTHVESAAEAGETVKASEADTASEETTATGETVTASEENMTAGEEDNEMEDSMRLLIGETEVPVTWEENASVEALKELSPVTIQMSMYGGFEQVGSIGQSIVRNDKQRYRSLLRRSDRDFLRIKFLVLYQTWPYRSDSAGNEGSSRWGRRKYHAAVTLRSQENVIQ